MALTISFRMSPSWSSTRSCSSGPVLRIRGGVLISTTTLQSMDQCLVPRLIVGAHNVVTNSLSHRHQVLSLEWTLAQGFVDELVARQPVSVALFATALNYWLPVYFSPIFVVWQRAQIPFLGIGMDYGRMPSHLFL